MKLFPVAIEATLAQSVAPKQGPVETALRAALELFGPNGENWIKGTARKMLEPGKITRHPILQPISVCFEPNKISPSTMRCEERVTPARYGYCSIGALMKATDMDDVVVYKVPEDVAAVFTQANGMANIDTIVQVNDFPGTEFSIVRKMFENAIAYARKLYL